MIPIPGRWKLWHLMVLVAAAAVIIAFPGPVIGLVMVIGVYFVVFGPAFWWATLWERYLKRKERSREPPAPLVASVLFRAIWFGGIPVLYWITLISMMSLFTDW